MNEPELYELAKNKNIDSRVIDQVIQEMDDLYFNDKAIYDSLCSREEILSQMAYLIETKDTKIKAELMRMVLNYPAPEGSHLMRDGRRKGEKLWFLFLGESESHKYSIFAKSEEDLFDKLAHRLEAVRVIKLSEILTGHPAGAFRCKIERRVVPTIPEKCLVIPEKKVG